MSREYVAFLAVGIILGCVAYMAVGIVWMLNYAVQNMLAG